VTTIMRVTKAVDEGGSRITHSSGSQTKAEHATRNTQHVATLLLALSLLLGHPVATRANVYATNIRLNGSVTNLSLASGSSVTISYLLNEPASSGVTVSIQSGSSVLRAINIPNGPGTLKGTNSVVWDGRDNIGHVVAGGACSVAVTAAATGYTNWTRLNDDTNSSIWDPAGIAVNKNTNSIYYGRIFVANSTEGFNPDLKPGDNIGIIKYNADGSWAEEGPLATGGYQWAHGQFVDGFSPWKLESGPDDRVYINDFLYRVVLSFDQLISTNSRRLVLTTNNYPNSQSTLDGLCLSGSATNVQLWMADSHDDSGGLGVGIRRWDLTAGGVVTSNDTGITAVTNGPGSDVDQNPKDLALDRLHPRLASSNSARTLAPSKPMPSGKPTTTPYTAQMALQLIPQPPTSRLPFKALLTAPNITTALCASSPPAMARP